MHDPPSGTERGRTEYLLLVCCQEWGPTRSDALLGKAVPGSRGSGLCPGHSISAWVWKGLGALHHRWLSLACDQPAKPRLPGRVAVLLMSAPLLLQHTAPAGQQVTVLGAMRAYAAQEPLSMGQNRPPNSPSFRCCALAEDVQHARQLQRST